MAWKKKQHPAIQIQCLQNYVEIKRKLTKFNPIELFRDKEVDDMYKTIVNILCKLIDMYVQKILCRTRKKKVKV